MNRISVIVPCHNPRQDYLNRALRGLEVQTLARDDWELIIVDNASSPPLKGWLDISWHPHGRIVEEDRLGLTVARLRGFEEAQGDALVMVDDDNVLAPGYLAQVLQIREACPFLGAFGGSIEPEFETPPAVWTRPYWGQIAIRPAARSVWSNDIEHWESTPSGAGMCVRRDVAQHYADAIRGDRMRLSLDRSGQSLMSGGDMDLVYTALEMGYGMGRFKELVLHHLISPDRLTVDYLSRMSEAKGYSEVFLDAYWKRNNPSLAYEGVGNLLRMGIRRLISDFRGQRFLKAKRRGAEQARACIDKMKREQVWHPRSIKAVPGLVGGDHQAIVPVQGSPEGVHDE